MTKAASTITQRAVNLRQLQRESTRQLLLDAATKSFRKQGFGRTSVDDIAKMAGTTRATFYLHFKSKAEVIHVLVERTSAEAAKLLDLLPRAVEAGDRDSLREWLRAAFDFWEEIGSTSRAEEEAATLHPEVRTARSRSFDRGVEAIASGLENAGRFDEPRRHVRAVLAYSQLQNLFHRWLRVGWDVDRTELLEVMTDMWLAGFSNENGRTR
jgi:AcrR family transcriptional regulator